MFYVRHAVCCGYDVVVVNERASAEKCEILVDGRLPRPLARGGVCPVDDQTLRFIVHSRHSTDYAQERTLVTYWFKTQVPQYILQTQIHSYIQTQTHKNRAYNTYKHTHKQTNRRIIKRHVHTDMR